MIEISTENNTKPVFLLKGNSSHYLIRVDDKGKLRQHSWAASADPASIDLWNTSIDPPGLFAAEANYLEIYPYGETTSALPSLLAHLPESCGFSVEPDTESPNFPVRTLDLRYHSYELKSDSNPMGFPSHGKASKRPRPQTLEIVLQDSAVFLQVSLFYRLYEECDIIERWTEIRNKTEGLIEIDRMMSATWSLPVGNYHVSTTTGQIFGEFKMQKTALPRGLTLTTRSGNLTTSHKANPTILLEDEIDCNKVFFQALAYSGNWRVDIESIYAGCVRIHAGEDDLDNRIILGPDQKYLTCSSFAGCSAFGKGDAAQKLHKLQRDYLQIDNGQRPILYNSWEATTFDLSAEKQIALADKAAEIGVELFVVDDGWFGGRRNDKAGLGDWIVSKEVFPDGLSPLIDHIHKKGMKFGIWFEPEMVNPDSDLYRAHPDWVLHFPGRDRSLQRHQLILDFGRPEVVEHIKSAMLDFLDENEVDFIKWDMNRLAHPAGSVTGTSIWSKHVDGVYSIMDTIRNKYPKISIQSCSAGGGRVDLGMAQRVEQFWTSDNTDAFHRIETQDTFSQFYAPNSMECWVTDSPNHQTQRIANLDTRFAVAMRGVLGIGSNLNNLSKEELTDYAQLISFYKKVRHLVQDGERHVISEPMHTDCSAWWFVNEEGNEGFLSSVLTEHKPGRIVQRLKLPGLDRNAQYRIKMPDESELPARTGAELEDHGLFASDKPAAILGPYPGAVRLLHVTRISN